MSTRRKVTVEEKENIKALLRSGKTGVEISEITGRSEPVICRIRKELQLEGYDIWHVGSSIAQSIPCAPGDIPEVHEEKTGEEKSAMLTVVSTKLVGRAGAYEVTGNDLTIFINGQSITIAGEDVRNFIWDVMDLGIKFEY